MHQHKPYRILLCDDDPDEALFLETAFKKAGYQVDLEYFNRCSRLLDHLPSRRERPDLIFLDINMPGEKGLECLAKVKQIPEYKDVPVIMYTTSSLSRDIEHAFKGGASLYVPKTDSEAALVKMADYVVSRGWQELMCPKKESFCYIPN
jgi:CheY-like chemotaxis protein